MTPHSRGLTASQADRRQTSGQETFAQSLASVIFPPLTTQELIRLGQKLGQDADHAALDGAVHPGGDPLLLHQPGPHNA